VERRSPKQPAAAKDNIPHKIEGSHRRKHLERSFLVDSQGTAGKPAGNQLGHSCLEYGSHRLLQATANIEQGLVGTALDTVGEQLRTVQLALHQVAAERRRTAEGSSPAEDTAQDILALQGIQQLAHQDSMPFHLGFVAAA